MARTTPYIHDVPAAEALAAWDEACAAAGCPARLEAIRLPLDEAVGRVLAEPVWAVRSSPPFDAAAMDGIAVRAEDTIGASETAPARLERHAYELVDTGDPMPPDRDAVVMREDVHEAGGGTVELRAATGRSGSLSSGGMATEEAAQQPQDDTPELLIKLRERKERHKQRHIVHRAGVVVFGVMVVLAGIVMSGPGVPGPGIAVILIGLGFLALEFDRAERLLEQAIIWADKAADRAEETSTTQRVIAGIVVAAAIAAFVVAAILWDIPLMPIV